MHWQEACINSLKHKAIRHDVIQRCVERLVIRNWDGSGIIQLTINGHKCDFRNARPHELEGFMDWEPY
jgi:hypothetical protein